MLHLLRALTPSQRSAVLASYLGWTVDAFDFFILVFVMDDIAEEFGSEMKAVTFATSYMVIVILTRNQAVQIVRESQMTKSDFFI
jgi:hypothetical protein